MLIKMNATSRNNSCMAAFALLVITQQCTNLLWATRRKTSQKTFMTAYAIDYEKKPGKFEEILRRVLPSELLKALQA